MYEDLLSESGLSLDRLRVLCEVIHDRTITKAVGGDSSRASHYSRQIRELNEYFGTQLFTHDGRTLVPTDKAIQLSIIARNFFAQISDFRADLAGSNTPLRIGAQETIIRWYLLPHLVEWQVAFPEVRFDLQNHRTQEMVTGLENAELDLAVLRADAVTSRIATHPLCNLEYALFIPKAVRSTVPKKITVRILKGLPLATLGRHGRFSSHLNELVDQLGEDLSIQATCNSFSLIVELMKVRDLAAILPLAASRGLSLDDFHVVQPSFLAPFQRTLVLAHLRNESLVRPFARNVALLMSKTFATS